MATTRKTLGDRLNKAADGAITTLISVSKGEIADTTVVNARVGAAKAILNKVIPDLRAIDLKTTGSVELISKIDVADD